MIKGEGRLSMNIQRIGGLVALCGLLAGCGGGNGGPTFASLDSRAEALATSAEALYNLEGFSDPAALPVDGAARYDGVIAGVILDEDLIIAGELSLIADFNGPGSISGSARNFVDDTENRYQGTLLVTNGDIFRDADPEVDFTYSADLDGTLSDTDDSYLVDGTLFGDFIGDN